MERSIAAWHSRIRDFRIIWPKAKWSVTIWNASAESMPAEFGSERRLSRRAENAPGWQLERAPWITFFTEPYETDFWRVEAIYREVLPRLCSAARRSGKTVVLKLHPFESARQRRSLVKRILSEDDRKLVSVTDAPLSGEILRKTWCAVTVESTVAFECAAVGIPVFLCGWLRHAYAGYAPQYVRFGVGRMLESPDDLLRIPDMLREIMPNADTPQRRLVQPISPEALSEVLCQPLASRFRPEATWRRFAMANQGVTPESFMITVFTPSFADDANTNAQNLTAKEIVSRLPPDRFRVVLLGDGAPDPRIRARENTEILHMTRHGNTARWLARVLLSKIDIYFFPRQGPLDTLFLFFRRSLGLPVALVTYIVMALDEIDVGPTMTRSIREADCVVGNSRYVARDGQRPIRSCDRDNSQRDQTGVVLSADRGSPAKAWIKAHRTLCRLISGSEESECRHSRGRKLAFG